MDTHDIRLFLALASVEHFGKASDAAHVSPSTLSRCIKRLEGQLGVALFERDNRRVNITPEGRRVQRFWVDALDLWEEELSELKGGPKSLMGELSLFCSVTASYSVLAPLLSGFKSAYPNIDIKLHTGDAAEAIGRVVSGTEAMAVAAKPDDLPAGLVFQELARSPLLFIVPKVSSVVSELMISGVGLDFWHDVPVIVSERGVTRDRLDEWFALEGLKPNVYAQVAGNEAIVSMVALGFGVGVVPELVLENSPQRESVEVLSVTPILQPFSVGLVCLKRRLANSLVSAFWMYVMQQNKEFT